MSNPSGPESRPPTPSTPPFLNISSPDFKSFKSFIKSPIADNDTLDRKTLPTEMDFEAAYAILINSPSFKNETSPVLAHPLTHLTHPEPQLPHIDAQLHHDFISHSVELTQQSPKPLRHSLQRPGSPSSSNMTSLPPMSVTATLSSSSATSSFDMMHDVLFKSNTPPPLPLPSSAGLNTLSQPQKLLSSPMRNPVDLESLSYFSKYDELLSVNETNALEEFLDSIIDDKKATTMTPAIAIDEKPHEQLHALPHTHPQQTHHELDFDDAYKQAIKDLEASEMSAGDGIGLSSLGSPLPDFEAMKRSLTPDTLYNENGSERSNQHCDGQENTLEKKPRKRRKVLSDEQKKLNHTTSEQKRRGAIKDAFDDLVKLLPDLNGENVKSNPNSKRKNQPKSIVLEMTAVEIEKLVNANNKLRRLLEEHE